MWSSNYYYIIVGGGLAGLQLASELSKDRFFEGKTVAIIDPDPKETNDKTWCFWEKGSGKWDDIIHKQWEKGLFVTRSLEKPLNLDPYKYKMLRSADFYSKVKEQLISTGNFTFIEDTITDIDPIKMAAYGEKDFYTATHFFDSRIPPDFAADITCTKIYQNFKGLMIETEKETFDPDTFTMMDYRVKHQNFTGFTYVLPLSATKALIEFTFFTPFIAEEQTFEKLLKEYIEVLLHIKNYRITETETGIIPMTDFPFYKSSGKKITKIGTGGSWVKGSTGYSFKSTEKKVARLISNIKEGKNPSEDLVTKKHLFYDSIFLDVLEANNELGEKLFTKFYTKNSTREIFKFLDEETSLREDLKVMSSLYHPEFIKSFFRKAF